MNSNGPPPVQNDSSDSKVMMTNQSAEIKNGGGQLAARQEILLQT